MMPGQICPEEDHRMTTPVAAKKSETLEVRLPYAAKTAFMARCRDDGRTASDAVRAFIETELDRPARERRTGLRWWQAMVAASIGLALGAVAAPSLAQSAPASRAAFDRLDLNRDGAVSFEEFRGG